MQINYRRLLKVAFYTLATIAVPALTYFLVALGQGYYYDLDTGQVTRRGLALINSRPEGARILVNGEDIGETTPHRELLSTGNYNLELARQDYRTWSKRIEVLVSEVTRLEYPILLRKEIETNVVDTLEGVAGFESSPNQQQVAYVTANQRLAVYIFDVDAQQSRRVYRSPPAENLQLGSLRWAPDNQRLLLQYRAGQNRQTLLVDSGGENHLNLGSRFNLQGSQLRFHPSNASRIYALGGGQLRRLDVSAGSSRLVASPVAAFAVNEDNLWYLEAGSRRHTLKQMVGSRAETIGRLPAKDYSLTAAKIREMTAVVAHSGQSQQVRIFDVTENNSQSRQIGFEPDRAVVAPGQRFILWQSNNSFASFDLEKKLIYQFQLPQEEVSPVRWVDYAHLVSAADGNAVMFEFDGGNQESIVSSSKDFTPATNPAVTQLISVGHSSLKQAPTLQVSTLREGGGFFTFR